MKINEIVGGKQRDTSLDIVRGIGCILMIFAHAKSLGRTIDVPWTIHAWYLGFFAVSIFFSCLGVSIIFQRNKYSQMISISFYSLLFFAGFADVGRLAQDYFTIFGINMFTSLAVCGMIASFFVSRNLPSMIVVLPIILDRVFNKLQLMPTFFHGVHFAVFPWLYFVLLGLYLQKNPKRSLAVVVISFSFFLLLAFRGDKIQDQLATTFFLSVATFIYSFMLVIVKKYSLPKIIVNALTYFSKHSLLFYWSHLLLLYVVPLKLFAPIIWIFVTLLTLTMMYLLLWLNRITFQKFSLDPLFWLVWVGAIIVPILFQIEPTERFIYFHVLLFIFALNSKGYLHLTSQVN